jgi:DNA (cytosine-5)-methyltransferase 1
MARVVSLFSGVAGLDLGLEAAGCAVVAMCESWEPARRVLSHHFPDIEVAPDVATFEPAHPYDVLTAGFPCTDLSHAGTKTGIFGPQSGLVEHVFRIAGQTNPEWIVLENVPNLLLLHSGAGIASVVDRLELLGYQWAYRTVDSRFTGVPQRRNRVILVAGRDHDPAPMLLSDPPGHPPRVDPPIPPSPSDVHAVTLPHGFYWTEGRNGLGLVAGAVPTLKGGSTIGTPSAPAVWFPDAPLGRRFVLPTIEDAEELQGLPRGWTEPSLAPGERDMRWKLIGNAVTTGVGEWVGALLTGSTKSFEDGLAHSVGETLSRNTRWPRAAAGGPGRPAVAVHVSDRPLNLPMKPLADVIDVSTAPRLSHRATKGFLSRVDEKNRRLDEKWYSDLEDHLSATRPRPPALKPESWASSPQTRARMQKQKQKDTKPEIAMRRELTALGLRYQLQKRPLAELRSRLDIVFKGPKVAVDIRGCFWHGCPQHGTSPKLNADRWAEKLGRNRARDAATVKALEENGWVVFVVWEHDDVLEKAKEIAVLVEQRKPRRRGPTSPGAGNPIESKTHQPDDLAEPGAQT